jgi:hypothetical protein
MEFESMLLAYATTALAPYFSVESSMAAFDSLAILPSTFRGFLISFSFSVPFFSFRSFFYSSGQKKAAKKPPPVSY